VKKLLIAAALGEALFGVFVFLVPELARDLLFGREAAAGGVMLTRAASIALVGLGVACFPRGQRQGLYGLLTYSVLVLLFLIVMGISGAAGILLWPAVFIHALTSALLTIAVTRRATSAPKRGSS
jgi:hypothetical protein